MSCSWIKALFGFKANAVFNYKLHWFSSKYIESKNSAMLCKTFFCIPCVCNITVQIDSLRVTTGGNSFRPFAISAKKSCVKGGVYFLLQKKPKLLPRLLKRGELSTKKAPSSRMSQKMEWQLSHGFEERKRPKTVATASLARKKGECIFLPPTSHHQIS